MALAHKVYRTQLYSTQRYGTPRKGCCGMQNPRQYSATIAVQCADVNVLPDLCQDVELMLAEQADVDNRLPLSASVIKYERNVATIALLVRHSCRSFRFCVACSPPLL